MCGVRWASITWQGVRCSLEQAVRSSLAGVAGGGEGVTGD
jgi:hypothetical protein